MKNLPETCGGEVSIIRECLGDDFFGRLNILIPAFHTREFCFGDCNPKKLLKKLDVGDLAGEDVAAKLQSIQQVLSCLSEYQLDKKLHLLKSKILMMKHILKTREKIQERKITAKADRIFLKRVDSLRLAVEVDSLQGSREIKAVRSDLDYLKFHDMGKGMDYGLTRRIDRETYHPIREARKMKKATRDDLLSGGFDFFHDSEDGLETRFSEEIAAGEVRLHNQLLREARDGILNVWE
jgi:hypothetical protein